MVSACKFVAYSWLIIMEWNKQNISFAKRTRILFHIHVMGVRPSTIRA